MNANKCPDKQRLADYTSGKLSEQAVTSIVEHLGTCPSCEATIVNLEAESNTLASGLRDAEPLGVPEEGTEYQQAIERLARLPQGDAASTPPSGKATSATLGPYALLAKLGEGGMGAVYKARHEHLGKIVAIKILPAKTMQDPAAVARFRREMKAVGQLHHPNIVTAFDAGEANGQHFLVMEYVEGSDLSAIVKQRGPIPVNDAIDYIRQAACGLAYAHSVGLVHRDIKPANLLLDKKGVVRILDMGLARFEDPTEAGEGLTQSGQVMGTVDYMAPEQAYDMRSVDAQADVYSLGCTLYRLLTGQSLYSGETMVQKILAHREKVIPSLRTVCPNTPAALDALYQRMVAKQPADRPTMAELVTALEKIAAEESKSGTTGRVGSSGKKKPPSRMLVAAGAAGFVILLFGVWILVRDKDDKEVARFEAKEGVKLKVPPDSTLEVLTTPEPKRDSDTRPASEPRPSTTGVPESLSVLPATWTPGLDMNDQPLYGLVPRPAEFAGVDRWQLETVRPRFTIRMLAWNPAGTHLACLESVVSLPVAIRVYEYVAGKLQLRHILPTKGQYGIWFSWSPDGKRLVAGQKGRVVVWELGERSAKIIAQRVMKFDAFIAKWSPTGPWIAISTNQGLVQLWNPDNDELGPQLKFPTNVHPGKLAWRPDGARLAVDNRDKTIRIWDPVQGSVVHEMKLETPVLGSDQPFAWSLDGSLLAINRTRPAGAAADISELWDVDKGEKKVALEGDTNASGTNLLFLPEGTRVTSTGHGVPAWNIPDGKPLGPQLKDFVRGPGTLGPSPHLVTSAPSVLYTDIVRIGNLKTSEVTTILEGPTATQSIAWSPDGQTIALGVLDNTLRFLNAADGGPRQPIKKLANPMGTIAWSADSRRLATAIGQAGNYVDKVQIWDTIIGKKSTELQAAKTGGTVRSVAWSADGKLLATAASETETDPVRIWADGNKTFLRGFPTAPNAYPFLFWSPDNRHLAVLLPTISVKIFDAVTGEPRTTILDKRGVHFGPAQLAFSPSGDRLVIVSADQPACRVWTLDGKPEIEIPGLNLGHRISWSPDGRWITSISGDIRFHDATTGKVEQRVTPPANGVNVSNIMPAWSPDGKFLAYAQQANTVGVIDVEQKEIAWVAILLPDGETAVMSPAGQLLVAPPAAENELCCVVETATDQIELLTPSEFARRYADKLAARNP